MVFGIMDTMVDNPRKNESGRNLSISAVLNSGFWWGCLLGIDVMCLHTIRQIMTVQRILWKPGAEGYTDGHRFTCFLQFKNDHLKCVYISKISEVVVTISRPYHGIRSLCEIFCKGLFIIHLPFKFDGSIPCGSQMLISKIDLEVQVQTVWSKCKSW